MSRDTWHTWRDGAVLTHARRRPARFDVAAEAVFPDLARGRLARQIRQDLWRHLRWLRAFSPAVEVARTEMGLRVRAGGQVEGAVPKAETEARIATLLADPRARARWIAHAGHPA